VQQVGAQTVTSHLLALRQGRLLWLPAAPKALAVAALQRPWPSAPSRATTPLCRHAAMPLRHYATMPLCRYATISTPLCQVAALRPDDDGATPVHVASAALHATSVAVLLSAGGTATSTTSDGTAPPPATSTTLTLIPTPNPKPQPSPQP
jgi:hypothetical protein